ncbi:hypothetical protein CBF90_02050 [Microbacterium sp. AISO3]|uniref:hypothetical protein n=1 Tax=Microbacterium sp. AISO3 TaxID=2002831 RepID=UPI000B654389|nr:hypothetical protein [Microbacterium sp. AISO3]OWP20315.1 hypothetical protein CBF90_17195 [Microbacterium sp. AISO3]OWP23532.1 hypothetical protein CBF90_02050 [Microbacterium sp. AISO3]
MTTLPFRDRPLSGDELEALRLVLSTYRDGSGQNQTKAGSMPGFRDFERGLASIIGGTAAENKGVFDVLRLADEGPSYGVSCKMAAFAPAAREAAFVELSNAAAKFRTHLVDRQINWVTEPGLAGPALVQLVTSWHEADAQTHGLSLQASKYAVLSRSANWQEFQLSAFPLDLYGFNPIGDIEWESTKTRIDGFVDVEGRRHLLWQWYPNSGGQLKWWPPLAWADWATPRFTLEEPPLVQPTQRAREYFPTLWPAGFTEA